MKPKRIQQLIEEAESLAAERPAEAMKIYQDSVALHEELGRPLEEDETLELSFKIADTARRVMPLKVVGDIYADIIHEYNDDRLATARAAYELGTAYMDAFEWEKASKALDSSLAYMTGYVAERQYFTEAEFALAGLINIKLEAARDNITPA